MSEENKTEETIEPINDETLAEVDEQADNATNPNAEAAKYRRRLREVEAERDALAAQTTAMQRDHIHMLISSGNLEYRGPTGSGGTRIHAPQLTEPEDLWTLGGHQLEEFITDEGTVDTTKLADATQALIDKRPELRRPARQKVNPAVSGMPGPLKTSRWEEAFSYRR